MGEIIINGSPFLFEDMPWVNEDVVLDKEDAKYMLSTMKKVLEKHGVHFLLNFGTLLGAVREHDFIGHDCDIDLSMHEKYKDKLLQAIPELYELGIKLCRYYYKGTIYSFHYKGIICDINVVFEPIFPYNIWFYKTLEQLYPKKYSVETEYIDFLGEQYEVPKNPERCLAYMYGDDWRIPQKGKKAKFYPDWMVIEKLWYRVYRKFKYLRAKYIYHTKDF